MMKEEKKSFEDLLEEHAVKKDSKQIDNLIKTDIGRKHFCFICKKTLDSAFNVLDGNYKIEGKRVCRACYKEKARVEKSVVSIKGQATYWGGHFLHPVTDRGNLGDIMVEADRIVFENFAIREKKKWRIEMLFDSILWDEVSQEAGKDIAYEQRSTAMAFFATGRPVSTFSKQITYLTIPFRDGTGKIHHPRFNIKRKKVLEQILNILYNKKVA